MQSWSILDEKRRVIAYRDGSRRRDAECQARRELNGGIRRGRDADGRTEELQRKAEAWRGARVSLVRFRCANRTSKARRVAWSRDSPQPSARRSNDDDDLLPTDARDTLAVAQAVRRGRRVGTPTCVCEIYSASSQRAERNSQRERRPGQTGRRTGPCLCTALVHGAVHYTAGSATTMTTVRWVLLGHGTDV